METTSCREKIIIASLLLVSSFDLQPDCPDGNSPSALCFAHVVCGNNQTLIGQNPILIQMHFAADQTWLSIKLQLHFEMLQKCWNAGKVYSPALLSLSALPPQGNQINQIPTKYSQAESTKFLVLTVVSILCIVAVLLASTVVYCLRHRSHHKLKEKLTNLGTDTPGDATTTYQVGGATPPLGFFIRVF